MEPEFLVVVLDVFLQKRKIVMTDSLAIKEVLPDHCQMMGGRTRAG